MRLRPGLALLVLLLLSALGGGCVSSYKHVVVSVRDETTGAPVAGATVRTVYIADKKFPLAAKRPHQALTDAAGRAVLPGNFLRPEPEPGHPRPGLGFEPRYEVVIDNPDYEAHTMTFQTIGRSGVFDRPEDFVPTEPDITFLISSRAEQARRLAARLAQARLDEEQAREWLASRPSFWPETKFDHQPADPVERKLLELRWETASPQRLGQPEDDAEIARVIDRHQPQPKMEVGERRWLTPALVMVYASWYQTPTAAGGYHYVLEKKAGRWVVLARYLLWIS